ncbi:hypothetical protein ACFYR1_47240 [Streptomyces canus]|uniref:hypothetical protein n=1 Tax=Streptomyces canus TaxID=58343 RepID=UPI0036C02D4D
MVVDASGVTFAHSTVLTLLLRGHRATELWSAVPTPQVLRVLELTGADEVLDVRATLKGAQRNEARGARPPTRRSDRTKHG